MQVILQRDVPKLGSVGEVVNVKPGYARNYLIPRGMALVADAGSVRSIEHARRLTEHAKRKARAEAEALAERMKDVNVTLPVRVGENDRLYGSVTARDIAKDLALQGWPVEAKRIVLETPIKTLGVFQVPVTLSVGVVAEIKVWVVQDRSAPDPEAATEEDGEEATEASAEAAEGDSEAVAMADADGDAEVTESIESDDGVAAAAEATDESPVEDMEEATETKAD
ncbi:MAG: 50S ribosomal protein L9 [Myxococcales bacterium]|nr:50S ribosomal protein L9 [Myxococcales bacterium]